MKILFLVSSMQGGGAERVATLLANAWSERGHTVQLVPTFSMHGECAYELSDKVQVTFLFDLVEGDNGRLRRLTALRSLIISENPDVILSFLPHVNCASILAAWGLGIPVVACERTFPPLFHHRVPWSYRILRRLLYPAADALAGQTKPISQWLRKRGGSALIATIPNPVVMPLPTRNPHLYPDSIMPSEAKLILWAGRFDEEKRPDLLIEAILQLGDRMGEWYIAMLGDGPLRPVVQELVNAAGLSDRVFLPGFAGNLADWYRRADLFVMSSSMEGFPNTLLEAMAHGVASIAFDVPTGPAELNDNGQRIMLLPDDNNVKRLSDAMRSLMSDAVHRQALATAGTDVAGTYSLDAILAQWEELFHAVTKKYQVGGEHTSS